LRPDDAAPRPENGNPTGDRPPEQYDTHHEALEWSEEDDKEVLRGHTQADDPDDVDAEDGDISDIDSEIEVLDIPHAEDAEDVPAFPPFQPMEEDELEMFAGDRNARLSDETALYNNPSVIQFTAGNAGAPVRTTTPTYRRYQTSLRCDNPWAPFESCLDWEVAEWAKMQGPGSTAFSSLLKIDGVCFCSLRGCLLLTRLLQVRERLGLSYNNSTELNSIIDNELPSEIPFKRRQIEVDGEILDMYYRDIISCVKTLYSNPEFLPHMVYAPECHYTDEDMTVRMYGEMNTGKWWWRVQVGPGLDVITIRILMDEPWLFYRQNLRTTNQVLLWSHS